MTKETILEANNIHVAIVVNNYPPKVGGLESHVANLAAGLQNRNIRVTVVAVDNEIESGLCGNVNVIRYKGTPMIASVLAFPWFGTGVKLRKMLVESGVTAISTHTRFFPMSFVATQAGKRLGIPVIHTEHGSDHVRGVTPFIGWASRLVDLTTGKYVLRSASRVLAISSAAQKFVSSLAGVTSTVFHNAIDTREFPPRTEERTGTAPRLTFLGRLVDGKGWEICLKVGEGLADEFPDLEMHFIGDGAQREELETAVKESPIRDRTVIHGYLQAPEIHQLLSDGILLNPTVLAEGFQTTLLEAVSSGSAVVSTPVAAAQYLADNGSPVTLVPSLDVGEWTNAARAYLLAPPPLLDANRLTTFDWSTRAREYEEIVRDVTGVAR